MADEDAATEGQAPDAAAGPDAAPSSAESSAVSEEEVAALLEGNPSAGNVRPFDLTSRRINHMQLPMLETVCKSVAEKFAQALSMLVGRDTTVQWSALDSGKAAELQAALPVPSSLCTVRLKPLPGNGFVSIEPQLLLALLDGFFGGTGRAVSDSGAAIAPATQRFQALVLRTLTPAWTAGWTPVLPLELELVKQETNPRLMQLGAPQDLLVVLRFAVECASQSGRIDWLLPDSLLAPIRELLASDGSGAPPRKQEVWAPVLGAALQEAEVETRAVLAQAKLSLGELVRLRPGDIIPIEAPQSATLLAGEVPLFRGRFGVSQGRNSLKILPGGP